jgi:hypothetical protein
MMVNIVIKKINLVFILKHLDILKRILVVLVVLGWRPFIKLGNISADS